MNEFLNNMERKFGKYAIPNLTLYIIGLYVLGYVLQLAPSSVNILGFLTLDPYAILHGQIWRLVSWLLIPPSSFNILIIITLFFYYFVGTSMERTMGTFRYNVFIFGGVVLMIIASFATMLVYKFFFGIDGDALGTVMNAFSIYFSTSYIQEMVFLAFAMCFPDVQVLLMFIIPIKVKYLGYFYAALLAYNAFTGVANSNYFVFFAIVFQFVNLLLFYLQTGKISHLRPKEVKRRREYHNASKMMPKGITRHKCAVCGRTEAEYPDLEFRFCSKCNGNYEYCQDHLFTHQHVK